MNSIYAIDKFVHVQAGEPFRLLPYGPLVKGGDRREVTRELASKFKLPHYQPAIKIGSHKQEAPAAGRIKRLLIGEDGLYAVPEFTDKGMKIMADGDYKYQSPEIIWEGGMEDPKTGETIEAPLVVGAALLHDPHLGEEAALFHSEALEDTHNKGESNMSEVVEVPKTFWDSVVDLFQSPGTKEEEQPEKEVPEVDVEKFEAIQSERDEFEAQIEAMKAEQEREELEAEILGEFDTEEYGAAYQEMAEDEDMVGMLAEMGEDQREWVLTQFRALSAQIKEGGLTKEHGTSGDGIDAESPREQLDIVVSQRANEKEVSYGAALKEIEREQPELVKEAYGGK